MEPTSEELLRALDMQAYAAHKSEPEANVLDPNKENIHKLVQMSRDDLKREDPDRYRRYLKAWLKMKTEQRQMTPSQKRQAAFRLRAMINLDDEERALQEKQKETHLRKGQIPLHRKIAEHIGAKVTGENDGYCVLPTGVGKTVLFTNIIEQMLRGQKAKVCIVVPSIPLLGQVKREIESRVQNVSISTYGGSDTDQITDHGIQIITYTSLDKLAEKDTFDLLILDEAHTATSGRRTREWNNSLMHSVSVSLQLQNTVMRKMCKVS